MTASQEKGATPQKKKDDKTKVRHFKPFFLFLFYCHGTIELSKGSKGLRQWQVDDIHPQC